MRFICDPGHGWLEVNWTELKALSLSPRDFSQYSYRKGNTFYLEGACDADKFIEAYKAKHGAEPTITDVYQDPCSIRNMQRIWE